MTSNANSREGGQWRVGEGPTSLLQEEISESANCHFKSMVKASDFAAKYSHMLSKRQRFGSSNATAELVHAHTALLRSSLF
jgi:hypothetical protein